MKRGNRTSAWKKYFTYHPLYKANQKANRPREVYANITGNKFKVFCNFCLAVEVGRRLQEGIMEGQNQPGYRAESREDIVLSRTSIPVIHKLNLPISYILSFSAVI